jgi:hypothetical protein
MTSQPTDQQLNDIEARAQAATPGPWGVYQFGGDTLIEIAAGLRETGHGYQARRGIARLEDEPLDNDPAHREWTAEEDWAQVQADAAFVAHAREDVDALLAEVRRLRAAETVLATLADRWQEMADHGDHAIGHFEGPAAATLDAEVGERGRTYRKAASDVREVLASGRIPHDLMTTAELGG